MAGFLFGAAAAILPSLAQISQMGELVENVGEAFDLAKFAAMSFYGSTIQSNIELNALIRQSAVVLSAQSKFFDAAGNEIEDVTVKYDILSDKIKSIQREIELETRDVVGATDASTNAVLQQVISNFGTLRGQSKQFADELQGITPLVVNLTSALKTFQIPDFQIPQEIRSLLQGDVNNPDSMLANRLRDLGLTREAIEQARATGEWLDLLMEKTQAFADMNATGATTIENSFSIIRDVVEQFSREVGEDPTFGLQEGFAKIAKIVNGANFAETLSEIADKFGEPVGDAIEQAISRAVVAFEKLSEMFDDEDLTEMAGALGRTLADIIGITTDIGLAIGQVVIAVGKGIGDILVAFDSLTTIFNNFNPEVSVGVSTEDFDKRPFQDIVNPKVYLEMDTFDNSYYQNIWDESQKIFDNKGPIKLLYELVLKNSIFGALSGRSGYLKDIAEAQKSTLSTIESEQEAFVKRYNSLKVDALKLSEIDTTDIRNFAPDLSADLNSEIARLSSLIDYSSLSEEGKTDIAKQLSEISSSSELKNAAQGIAQAIIVNSTNIDVEQFQGQLNLVYDALANVQAEREAALTEAQATNTVDDIKPYLDGLTQVEIKYRSFIDEILINKDPAVQAQKALISELEATGQSTDKATEKLKELSQAAVNTGNAISKAVNPPSQGQTLVNAFTKAENAAASFANTLGKDPQKLMADFEGVTKSITTALEVGAIDAASAMNTLTALSTSDLLKAEDRIAAYKQIVTVVSQEVSLKKSVVDIESKLVELAETRGEISSEEAQALNSQVQQKNLQLEIDQKQAQLLASQQLSQAGLAEGLAKLNKSKDSAFELTVKSLEAQREAGTLSEKEYQTQLQAAEAVKAKEAARISEISKLAEAGSLGQQQLSNEIESLKIQIDIAKSKDRELEITRQLKEAEEARQNISAELAQSQAKYSAALEQSLLGGEITQLAKTRLESNAKIIELANKERTINQELLDKKRALRQADEVSLEFRQNLLREIVQLETDAINTKAQQAQQEMAYIQAEYNETKGLIDQVAKAGTDELNAKEAIIAAQDRLNQAIRDNLATQKDIEQSSEKLANALGGIEIVKLNYEIGNLEEVQEINRKLLSPELSEDVKNQLIERKEILLDAAEATEASEEAIKQRRDERYELERKAIEFNRKAQIEAAQLQANMSNLKIQSLKTELELEKAKLAVLREQMVAERALLQSQESIKGFLTDEQQSRKDILSQQIESNEINSEAVDESLKGLDDQKILSEKVLELVVEKATAEAEHSKNVSETNQKLDDQRKVNSDIASTPDKVGPAKSAAARDNFGGDNVASIKKQADGSFIINGDRFNAAEGNRILKNMQDASKNIQGNTESFQGVLSEWDYVTSRILGQLANTQLGTLNSAGLNESQVRFLESRGLNVPGAEEDNNAILRATRSRAAMSGGSNSDALAEFLAANPNANNDELVRLTQRASQFTSLFNEDDGALKQLFGDGFSTLRSELSLVFTNQIKDLRFGDNGLTDEEYRAGVDRLNESLDENIQILEQLNTAMQFSNMLLSSAESITKLAGERQLSAVNDKIGSLADTIIDFYEAEASNPEIAALGERLESLLLAPNQDEDEILRVANLIKEATERTAENTEEEPQFISVLDSIRQGSFFDGAFKDAPGTSIVEGDNIVYSGNTFNTPTIVQPTAQPVAQPGASLDIGSTLDTLLGNLREERSEEPASQGLQIAGGRSEANPGGNTLSTSGGGGGGNTVTYRVGGGGGVSYSGSRPAVVNNYNYPDTTGTVSNNLRASGF